MHEFLAPFLDPASRTNGVALLVAVVVAGGLAWRAKISARELARPFLTRSTALDVQLLIARQLLRAVGLVPAVASSFALAVAVVTTLDRIAVPAFEAGPLAAATYTLLLFVCWDASRFATHWLMHRVPVLWSFHQVHHSAEALTPLTFHRVHPVESIVYQLRGVLVTGLLAGVFFWLFRADVQPWTVLGVHAIGWALNVVSGNLRHSEIWWSFGRLERWWISPAQHQIHHGRGTDHVNFGTWLAVWDRLAGTWRRADVQPEAYGIVDANHDHDLLSAWFGPVRHAVEVSTARWRRVSSAPDPESSPPV